MQYAPRLSSELLIEPAFGKIAGYAYRLLGNFTMVNISLAVFNLLPVPPLDGSHVVHNILLRHSPYASQKLRRIAHGALLVLIFTGLLGKGLSFVTGAASSGVGIAISALARAIGLV